MRMHACVHGEGEGESVSNWHFRVVVPQPIGFCVFEKQANCSTWFVFLCLICHFLARHFLAKCSFHSSVCLLPSCRSRRMTETLSLGTGRKIQKLVSRLSERNIRQIDIVKSSCGTSLQSCGVCHI